MPAKEFFDMRCREIRDFERYLWESGYRLVKISLNESKGEQAKRFVARIDDERKNWKFSESDMRERELWDEYMIAYEDAIGATATKKAPRHVIPADQKCSRST